MTGDTCRYPSCDLEPGLAFVEQPDRGAMQRLVLGADVEGETLWVDAGGVSNTYGLLDGSSTRRELQGIRIARAFTAHQHFQLVQNTVGEASGRTELLVVPNLCVLYEMADQPAAEIDRLLDGTIELLTNLAESLDVPALVSAPHASDERRDAVRDLAVDIVECRRTGLGYAFSSDEFETHGYWQHGWWQTTIPYWVELFGAVETLDRAFEAHVQAELAEV